MRYITAGESHGPALTVIVEGVPAGLEVSPDLIAADLERRRTGHGRSARQGMEADAVEFTGGIRNGRTIGSPVSLLIRNADFANHAAEMSPFGAPGAISSAAAGIPGTVKPVVIPRPGHADLVGALKTATEDCRDIAERASARETAARVAAAGIAREFLAVLGVDIRSYVVQIGKVRLTEGDFLELAPRYAPLDIETSEVRCPNAAASETMCRAIDTAAEQGDTLGGVFRVCATGLLPGIGGYASGADRLSARIGAALFSVPSVKAVEFGLGTAGAGRSGSEYHDAILVDRARGFIRSGNNAGGLEGGMSTGMPLVATVTVKPIPTLGKPLMSVDMETLEAAPAPVSRADVCAVPAAAVVAESELAFVLADAYLEKFGADSMTDVKAAVEAYRKRLRTASR